MTSPAVKLLSAFGGAADTPILIGTDVRNSVAASTWATSSFTAEPGDMQYVVFVHTNNESGTANGVHTLTGMGLTWTNVDQISIDNSGTPRARASVWQSYGTATTGALTVGWSTGNATAQVAVVAYNTSGGLGTNWDQTTTSNPAAILFTPAADRLLLMAVFVRLIGSTSNADGGVEFLGETGEDTQTDGNVLLYYKLSTSGSEIGFSWTHSGTFADTTWSMYATEVIK